jgi:hypothetical protein
MEPAVRRRQATGTGREGRRARRSKADGGRWIAFRAPAKPEPANAKRFISRRETKRFAPWSQVIEITHGREIGHFAGLFVFNGLSALWLREILDFAICAPVRRPVLDSILSDSNGLRRDLQSSSASPDAQGRAMVRRAPRSLRDEAEDHRKRRQSFTVGHGSGLWRPCRHCQPDF